MKNTFAIMADGSNNFTRRWGTRGSAVDPYITGYHFINWAYLPPKLAESVGHIGKWASGIGNGDIKNILQSSCLSVTIPGAVLNKTEFNGLGNVRWAAPTNVDVDNNTTMRFLEASGMPIHSIAHGWVRMMRDYRTGVSVLTGSDYTKPNYAGTVYYWTTEPNGLEVEYHCCMTGLFPLRDPSDQFGHDITAYDKLEIDLDFNVDYMWHEEWTRSFCESKASEYHSGGTSAIDGYGSEDSSPG
jgi:hypothetical protein